MARSSGMLHHTLMSGQPGEDVAKILVVDDEEVIREILADFLTHCDLVKFARHRPGAADRERQLEAAAELVRVTGTTDGSPPPTAPSPGAGA